MKKFLLALGIAALVIMVGFATCADTNNPPAEETYTVSFDNTDGTGGQIATVTAKYDKAMPALTAQAPTKEGNYFNGYWDAESGGTMYYTPALASAKKWDKKEKATLYAQWTQIQFTTITFDNNGGSGSMLAQQIAENTSANLNANTFTRFGYTFAGWAASYDGTVTYADGASYSAAAGTNPVTLFAVWDALPPPVVSADFSAVSLVKAPDTVTQVSNITYEEVLAMTREAIKLAGGLDGIVKSGDVVMLKLNAVSVLYNWGGATSIPARYNGVTTDRNTVKAVAQIVREIVGPYNATTGRGKIIVFEGSGHDSTQANFTRMEYTLQNFEFVDEILYLESEGTWSGAGQVNAASAPYFTQKTVANYSYTGASGTWADYYKNDGKYWVSKRLDEADVFINIPVVKTHWDACVTGSIKNISIGAAPPKIYGISNTNIGRNSMVNHASNAQFHGWIADYFAALPCDFTVMDGLQGIEHGPMPSTQNGGVGNAQQLAQWYRNLRCILASKDALAIDTVEANIIGYDYLSVPYMVTLTAKGQVPPRTGSNRTAIPLRGNPKDIVVLGNVKVDDVRGTEWASNRAVLMPGTKISVSGSTTPPTLTINSAAFSTDGSTLNLVLTPSSGANNTVVKVDVYVDGLYKDSFNTTLTSVSVDASDLADGSHDVEVRAFTKYMYCTTATETAVK